MCQVHDLSSGKLSQLITTISKVEQETLADMVHIMKCSDVQVDTAQMPLPVWLAGLGIHPMSDRERSATF